MTLAVILLTECIMTLTLLLLLKDKNIKVLKWYK